MRHSDESSWKHFRRREVTNDCHTIECLSNDKWIDTITIQNSIWVHKEYFWYIGYHLRYMRHIIILVLYNMGHEIVLPSFNLLRISPPYAKNWLNHRKLVMFTEKSGLYFSYMVMKLTMTVENELKTTHSPYSNLSLTVIYVFAISQNRWKKIWREKNSDEKTASTKGLRSGSN